MSDVTNQAAFDAAGAFYRGTGTFGDLAAAVKAHEADEKKPAAKKPAAKAADYQKAANSR